MVAGARRARDQSACVTALPCLHVLPNLTHHPTHRTMRWCPRWGRAPMALCSSAARETAVSWWPSKSSRAPSPAARATASRWGLLQWRVAGVRAQAGRRGAVPACQCRSTARGTPLTSQPPVDAATAAPPTCPRRPPLLPHPPPTCVHARPARPGAQDRAARGAHPALAAPRQRGVAAGRLSPGVAPLPGL